MSNNTIKLDYDIVSLSCNPRVPHMFAVATTYRIDIYDSRSLIICDSYEVSSETTICKAKFSADGKGLFVSLYRERRHLADRFTFAILDTAANLKISASFFATDRVTVFANNSSLPNYLYTGEGDYFRAYDTRVGTYLSYKQEVQDIAVLNNQGSEAFMIADRKGGISVYEKTRPCKPINFYHNVNSIQLMNDSKYSIINDKLISLYVAGDIISSFSTTKSNFFTRLSLEDSPIVTELNPSLVDRSWSHTWANYGEFYENRLHEPVGAIQNLKSRRWHYWNDILKNFSFPESFRNAFMFHDQWAYTTLEKPSEARCLRFSPHNDLLYIAGDGGLIKEYSCDKDGSLNFERILSVSANDILHMDLSADASYIIFASNDRTVEFLRLFHPSQPYEAYELS